MKSRRFFAQVWRANSVLLLLAGVLACLALAFAAFQVFRDATLTRL